MKSFTLPMKGKQRPIIELYGNEALIDTGAVIPIVNLSPNLLKLAWNAQLVKNSVEIGGIGGKSAGSIYALHNFIVGDFIYEHLEVFVPNQQDIKYAYLLSATMFCETKYCFDMTNEYRQEFTVIVPDGVSLHRDFRILDLDGKMYVQVNGVH